MYLISESPVFTGYACMRIFHSDQFNFTRYQHIRVSQEAPEHRFIRSVLACLLRSTTDEMFKVSCSNDNLPAKMLDERYQIA